MHWTFAGSPCGLAKEVHVVLLRMHIISLYSFTNLATALYECVQVCYASQYQGQDRGVLVTLGTRQFGHFPLGLFDEGMDQPAPTLSPPN
jgi:hypothetical protein